ncbi:hypothetical protein CBS9595_001754 [Malassezia furfur]|nr:hypothetical protein CBS9595_001754 [Malassezia furfur]
MSDILALPVDYVPIHANSSLFSSVRIRRPPTEGDWQHNEFSFEPFVKRELQLRLDTDDKVCPRYRKGRCALQSQCPLRHIVTPSPAVPAPGRDALRRTVCKHWLRGLCKKGDACDYLHEYDLRRMAECRFYATYGFCNAGDECLYVHIDPSVKRRECELYKRGFCPRGPQCPKKHIRQVACPVKALQPTPESRATTPLLTHRPLPIMEAFGTGPGIHELPTDPRTGRAIVPEADWAAAEELRKTPMASAPRDPRRRELNEVLCYKCGEYGHFANACPHPGRMGARGGMDRNRWR